MLCAAAKALAPSLPDDMLWRDVDFRAQGSDARPLAAHLQQFGGWARARAAHFRTLSISFSHTADPGADYDSEPGFYDPERDWFAARLAPGAFRALLALLAALAGAPQLSRLRLDVCATPPWHGCELPGSALQLPGLEELELTFPLLRLKGSALEQLTHLRRLRVRGVQLAPTARLPASLTALEGVRVYIAEREGVDAIEALPRAGAPGLRSLCIQGGRGDGEQDQLLLDGLRRFAGLTSLALDGRKLSIRDQGAWEGAQLTPALHEMACLRGLERLRLRLVWGVAIKGQPLALPHWPALKARPLGVLWLTGACSVCHLS